MADIYGLFDADGELRYIGKANDPDARLKSHMREITRRSTPLYNWLAKHGEPLMIVLETYCEDWRISERDWIASARIAGANLLNLADGGDEPSCTREQRSANARKNNAAGHGFTSEQGRKYGRQLNDRLKHDEHLREIRLKKVQIGQYIRRYGFSPEQWAKLWLLVYYRPKDWKAWFERLADKYVLSWRDEEWVRFHSKLDELVDGPAHPQVS